MDYGWDTSDEEGGMEIDLDAKQEEHREQNTAVSESKDESTNSNAGSRKASLAEDYDPSEPTDDYDPAEAGNEPTDSSVDKNAEIVDKADNATVQVSEYDPAEPTLSDEDGDEENNKSPEVWAADNDNSQAEADQSQSDDNDGRWDSQLPMTQEGSPSSPEYDNSDSPERQSPTFPQKEGEEDGADENCKVEEAAPNESPDRTNTSPKTNNIDSPTVIPVDTDDNTQNSFPDDQNSDVPEVTFDESDFVLEKEPFETEGEQKNNSGSPWSKSDTSGKKVVAGGEEEEDESNQNRYSDREEEERERSRRQEEVDVRNEEALVDLFREESEPDRIEEDMEQQPVKKTKKKIGSKKLKKKGKKMKKGQGKKGQGKQQVDGEVEDQRFVEIRRDRQSVESREEGELDGEGVNFGHRKDLGDRVALNMYERALDVGSGHHEEEEQREPGEIVEEGKKKGGKKRDKKERKKKKSRREVATIEEGAQGDDDSQKFPSFLAGFFVQDEGDEDLDESIDISRSFENDEDRPIQKSGGKNYRKRHDSGAEDSVKSFEQNVVRDESQEMRNEEPEHRKSRKHDERRHESRERRHESRERRHESRDVRREKEHRHGTPRDKERERDRDRSRGERERVREKERDNRERDREREVVRDRERDRTRRVEPEERRRRHTRSGSRERRRRSASGERARLSRSRDRLGRNRRRRSKSRERSGDREREREKERERSKRRHRDRSRERESERRVRRQTHSRSRSPHRRSERASSNKENRDESHRRRRHVRAEEESDSDDRHSGRRQHRRQRRERERSSSSSSSSSNSTSSTRHRTSSHHHSFQSHQSSDEGASSDVILVEPERIVINLDEEEDPPSRIDITHAHTEDDSTKLVDGESIPPPPELSSRNARSSALIQINPAESDNDVSGQGEEGDATPTRDEHTDSTLSKQQQQEKSVPESDYDPAHPTEEAEDRSASPAPASAAVSTPVSVPVTAAETGPVPPDHPPPQEVRPSPPPVPALVETNAPSQPPPLPGGVRPQLHLGSPFQQQPPPPAPQQPSPQPGLLPFPGGPPGGSGPGQRFPHWPLSNGPNANMMAQNNGPPPGFPQGQRGLLPTPDTRPVFPMDSSRPPPPFASSLPHLSQPPPPRLPHRVGPGQPPLPLSAMAPLAQLTSLLPALERAKMINQDGQGMPQPSQMFKHPLPVPSGLMGKGPLMSSSAPNMSSGQMRSAMRGGRGGGDFSESTEVVDMDMSPGEDDCELELPSPNSSDSDRDDRRRRGRKSDSHSSRNDVSKSGPGKGIIQPAVYLKALSKAIEKLAPKGQPQTSGATGSSQDRSRAQPRKRRVEINDDDVPGSAVDLTNKEKYMKKLHLQERVIDEVKLAIKPFYSSKKITKEQYKLILRKAVPKICHSKSGNINPQKIQQLVEAYVAKLRKGPGAGGKKKKAQNAAKEGQGPKESTTVPPAKQNGERAKKPTR